MKESAGLFIKKRDTQDINVKDFINFSTYKSQTDSVAYYTDVNIREVFNDSLLYSVTQQWVYGYGNWSDVNEPLTARSDTFEIPDEYVTPTYPYKYYVVNTQLRIEDYSVLEEESELSCFPVIINVEDIENTRWFQVDEYWLGIDREIIAQQRSYIQVLQDWPAYWKNFSYHYDTESGFAVSIGITSEYQRHIENILELKPKEKKNLIIFPQPAVTMINIKTEQKGNLKILDINGRIVKEIHYNNGPIDISNIPSGRYFVILDTGKEKMIGVFTKY